MEDRGNHILILHPIVGNLNALHRGQAIQHHLLHGLLHIRIAVKAQIYRETDHRRLRNAHILGKLIGGHEGRLVIGFQDILGDPLLSLGKPGHILF